ncbi:MAG: class I SAM-dependent RNA methyltransferase [Chloroflexota bacterium]
MTPELITITLDKLAYGGDALGRIDGRAVFIPFSLPGETVRARVVAEKRGHLRAALVEVLEPSPLRIVPKCKYFGVCGGCHYQHLAYEAQLQAKAEILSDQLTRIGKIEKPPMLPIIPSPQAWNYRNHIQFHISEKGCLGYVAAEGSSVLPVDECHLPEPPLNALWPKLDLSPELALERVSLRLGDDEVILLILESTEPPEMDLEADISVVHLAGDDTVVMAGEPSISITVEAGGSPSAQRTFHISANSFFQVNTPMTGKMVAHLLKMLPVSAETTLLDVYCGAGLFAAFFAPHVGRVIGIEASPSACEDFAINLDDFNNVDLYEAPAEAVLPHLDIHPEIILVDPPRAGLDKIVIDSILAMDPDQIAYISCDPATLGRDAARLIAGGYRLLEVTPFDLFPQTYHIESISLFAKVSADN